MPTVIISTVMLTGGLWIGFSVGVTVAKNRTVGNIARMHCDYLELRQEHELCVESVIETIERTEHESHD